MKINFAVCVLLFTIGCTSKPQTSQQSAQPQATTTTVTPETEPTRVGAFPAAAPEPPPPESLKPSKEHPAPASIPAPILPEVKPTVPPPAAMPKQDAALANYKAPAPGPIPPPPPSKTSK